MKAQVDNGELCFTFGTQASFDCLKRSFERSFKQMLKDLCLYYVEVILNLLCMKQGVIVFQDSQVLTWHITT